MNSFTDVLKFFGNWILMNREFNWIYKYSILCVNFFMITYSNQSVLFFPIVSSQILIKIRYLIKFFIHKNFFKRGDKRKFKMADFKGIFFAKLISLFS